MNLKDALGKSLEIANLTRFARRWKKKGHVTFPPFRFVAPNGASAVAPLKI